MLRSYLARGLKFIADGVLISKQGRRYSTDCCRRLEGKVALITGGASGIGKTTAREFIKHGARVIIADKDSQTGPQAATELGPAALFVQCDVAAEAQVEEAVKIAMANHGRLDIMYNNAGVTGPSYPPSIADLDLDDFDEVMQVNVRGTVAGIKHAARAMIPAGSGCILCTSSIGGIIGGAGSHSYSASKSTVPGIVKSVASELCKNGIRINCISPGPIPTPLTLAQIGLIYPGASHEQLVEIVNGLGQLKGAKCEEADVAGAALYLASDEAKYVTGHNLVVDGGFTCFKNLPFPSPHEFL
ncbi:ALCOHOL DEHYDROGENASE-LIKE PROTEIN [Salix viminalis]|uniref:ALCOHOL DEHYDROGENASE-LIKE PROTEIN n=1 Tax=Salix viminalis TaxID=40686 RepID=A0A9Q0ZC34_SALVM|nr:ALCOHOL DEHYDROGENASE-LIKE PROTEIN [Salix viminalis]